MVLQEAKMKGTGPHPHNRLSPPAVRALKNPGRYSDGNGLYLVVSNTGSKKWILRTVIQGRRTDIGLGGHSNDLENDIVTVSKLALPRFKGHLS